MPQRPASQGTLLSNKMQDPASDPGAASVGPSSETLVTLEEAARQLNDAKNTIRALQLENAELKEQLKKAKSEAGVIRTGGTLPERDGY